MRAQDIKAGKFESIVGFAYGVDFGAPDNAYRITLEIEIWVSTHFGSQSFLSHVVGLGGMLCQVAALF